MSRNLKEPLQLVQKEVQNLLGLLTRHYGPGPHKGTGTPQDVHGGNGAPAPPRSFHRHQIKNILIWLVQDGRLYADWAHNLSGSGHGHGELSHREGIGYDYLLKGVAGWVDEMPIIAYDDADFPDAGYDDVENFLKYTNRIANVAEMENPSLYVSNTVSYKHLEPVLQTRHYGPGPHKGTGTPQDVHGGQRGTGYLSWQDRYIEHIPKHMGKRDVPEGMIYQPARWLGLHSEGFGDVFRELAKQEDYGGRVDWYYIEEKILRFEKDISYERDKEWIFEGDLSPADEGRRKEMLTLWREFPGALPPALEVARQLNLRLLERDLPGVILAISDVRAFQKSGALLMRHYGPGPHKGTGTPQSVHGGNGRGDEGDSVSSFDPSVIERGQPNPGFCFSDSAQWFLYEQGRDFPQARLIHGTVMGQGPIEGKRFVHSWVEIEDWVYDPSQDLIVHKKQYYDLGQVENTVSYTDVEAMRNMAKTMHWGPWDNFLLEFREEEMKEWFK